jgi:hypothetical protein
MGGGIKQSTKMKASRKDAKDAKNAEKTHWQRQASHMYPYAKIDFSHDISKTKPQPL